MTGNNKKWLKEYEEFRGPDSVIVPDALSKKVLNKMSRIMNPNAFKIFAKLFGIHLIMGTLSLSICHQFGLNPFRTESSFADWFMEVGGHSFCMVACGIVFLSLSLVTAGYFFSLEEVRVLRKTEFLQVGALSILSLGLFIAVGAELAITIAGLWFVGGLVGGFLSTEAIWHFKKA